MNQHLLRKASVKTVYVYVIRIIKQGLGMLCKWNIGGDCMYDFKGDPVSHIIMPPPHLIH